MGCRKWRISVNCNCFNIWDYVVCSPQCWASVQGVRVGDTMPKIFLGLVMLTLLTHLCWRWALARVVLPLRVESSSSLVFKGGCSWPGLHCVDSFPGIQLMKFGLFLSHSCSSFMIWLLLKCVGISEITMSVCFLFWNLRSESETRKWLPKNASKYIFSLLPFCPAAVAEVEQCGLELGKLLPCSSDLMVEG